MNTLIDTDEFKLEGKDYIYYYLLKVTGIFKITMLYEVRQEIQKIMSVSEGHLIFDLSDCNEMDSSAIGLLTNLHKLLTKKGANVGLLTPSDEIIKIMNETKLSRIIPIYNSHEDIEDLFD